MNVRHRGLVKTEGGGKGGIKSRLLLEINSSLISYLRLIYTSAVSLLGFCCQSIGLKNRKEKTQAKRKIS